MLNSFLSCRSCHPLNYISNWKHPIRITVDFRIGHSPRSGRRLFIFNIFPELINWKYCPENQRHIHTIAKQLNMSMALGMSKKYGYIYYVYSGIEANFAYTANVEDKQWSIVYCNFDPPPSQQSSLLLWLHPLTAGLWIAQLCLLASVPLITIIIRDLNRCCFQTYVTELFSTYGTLLRQSIPKSSITSLGLTSMTMYSIVVLSRYEYFHTSQLVVPNNYVPISSLREFVARGYKIKVGEGDWDALLKTAFESQHLEDVYNKSTILLKDNETKHVFLTFSKDDPNFGYLEDLPQLRIRHIRNRILKGKYDCYSFVWAREFYYFELN